MKLGLVEIRVLRLEEATSSIAQTKATAERQMRMVQPQLDAARTGFSSAAARYRKEAKLVDDLYSKLDELHIRIQRVSGPLLYELIAERDKIHPDFDRAVKARNLAENEVASAKPRLAELERQAQRWNSAALYFTGLPSPVTSAKTDADGKFSIMLDSKAIVALAANATRMVANKAENYYWIFSVSLDGRLSKRIFLSNDNLVTSGSKDSLVHVGE